MPAFLDKLRRKVESQYFYKIQIRALDNATDKTRVRLRHWRPRIGANFGDELSVAIVDQMLALRGLRQDFTVLAAQGLLGVGSILQMARDPHGSGFFADGDQRPARSGRWPPCSAKPALDLAPIPFYGAPECARANWGSLIVPGI